MNASQAGIHRHTQAEGRASQPASQRQQQQQQRQAAQYDANAGTDNVSVFVYLLHWCVYLCIVHSVRSLGTFRWLVRSMCAKQRQQHSTTHTHHHTRTRTCTRIHTLPTYVCIWLWYWPGRAFIVCVAEQKFCCSLYEHTATAVAAAAARASLWTVAGHMKRRWWGGGRVRVRPTATSTEHGRLPACLLGLPCAKRFAPNSHAVE